MAMTMSATVAPRALECSRLGPAWRAPLATFLRALEAAGDHHWFHPHPFTEEALDRLCTPEGQGADLYYVLVDGEAVLGYGLLRGWNEGYEIPSLGIAIAPAARRQGLGRAFMRWLHGAARDRGARQVRLRVDAANAGAATLYQELGYRFDTREGPYLVGLLDLESSR